MNINEIRNGIMTNKEETEILMNAALDEASLAWKEFEAKKQIADRLKTRVQNYNYALTNLKSIGDEEA